MNQRYTKDECMALLRDSADAHSCRTEMIIVGPVAALWLVIGVIALMLDQWITGLLGIVVFGGIFAYEALMLYGLYHNWDRYEYLHGEVKGEIATYDWRRDCTALQVYARRSDGTGVMANTRNIYRQKSVWLDGWPIATHYANSTVLIAYDARHDRAIILQRTYRSKK